jgi:hypothetical protein
VAAFDDRPRRRGALLVLASLAVLAHPVVANGPGPDRATVYEGEPVDTAATPPEGILARHPAVSGDFTVSGLVRRAANGTYRANGSAPPGATDLLNFEFFWDDGGGQYYAVDARIRGNTFLLDSRPVNADEVAATVAVPAADASGPVRRAARTGRAYADYGGDRRAERVAPDPTLVDTEAGYVLVTRARGTAPDRFRWAKLGAYGVAGLAGLAGIGLRIRRRRAADADG